MENEIDVYPVKTRVVIRNSADNESDWIIGDILGIKIGQYDISYEVGFWDGGFMAAYFPEFLIRPAEECKKIKVGFR